MSDPRDTNAWDFNLGKVVAVKFTKVAARRITPPGAEARVAALGVSPDGTVVRICWLDPSEGRIRCATRR